MMEHNILIRCRLFARNNWAKLCVLWKDAATLYARPLGMPVTHRPIHAKCFEDPGSVFRKRLLFPVRVLDGKFPFFEEFDKGVKMATGYIRLHL